MQTSSTDKTDGILASKNPLRTKEQKTQHYEIFHGNSSFGYGAIDHSHSQRPVLRIFPLDQSISKFYIKLAN